MPPVGFFELWHVSTSDLKQTRKCYTGWFNKTHWGDTVVRFKPTEQGSRVPVVLKTMDISYNSLNQWTWANCRMAPVNRKIKSSSLQPDAQVTHTRPSKRWSCILLLFSLTYLWWIEWAYTQLCITQVIYKKYRRYWEQKLRRSLNLMHTYIFVNEAVS